MALMQDKAKLAVAAVKGEDTQVCCSSCSPALYSTTYHRTRLATDHEVGLHTSRVSCEGFSIRAGNRSYHCRS